MIDIIQKVLNIVTSTHPPLHLDYPKEDKRWSFTPKEHFLQRKMGVAECIVAVLLFEFTFLIDGRIYK